MSKVIDVKTGNVLAGKTADMDVRDNFVLNSWTFNEENSGIKWLNGKDVYVRSFSYTIPKGPMNAYDIGKPETSPFLFDLGEDLDELVGVKLAYYLEDTTTGSIYSDCVGHCTAAKIESPGKVRTWFGCGATVNGSSPKYNFKYLYKFYYTKKTDIGYDKHNLKPNGPCYSTTPQWVDVDPRTGKKVYEICRVCTADTTLKEVVTAQNSSGMVAGWELPDNFIPGYVTVEAVIKQLPDGSKVVNDCISYILADPATGADLQNMVNGKLFQGSMASENLIYRKGDIMIVRYITNEAA